MYVCVYIYIDREGASYVALLFFSELFGLDKLRTLVLSYSLTDKKCKEQPHTKQQQMCSNSNVVLQSSCESLQTHTVSTSLQPSLFACFQLCSQLSANCYFCTRWQEQLSIKQEVTSHPPFRDITRTELKETIEWKEEKNIWLVERGSWAVVAQMSQTAVM